MKTLVLKNIKNGKILKMFSVVRYEGQKHNIIDMRPRDDDISLESCSMKEFDYDCFGGVEAKEIGCIWMHK